MTSLRSISIDEKGSSDLIGPQKSLKKDLWNIMFLMFLYFLQGVPTGLLWSFQFMLSSRNASYADQGTFSLSGWPFSFKLLWAPIVDAWYINRIGRRKSWLVPVQFLIGLLLIFSASYIQRVLGNSGSSALIHQEIYYITAIMAFILFLAATQDIAVDAWAITILSKENMEWASICNNAGATIGIVTGNSIFLVLDSANFCNKYIRSLFGFEAQPYGLLDLREFMIIFGVIFITSTTLILFFKNEKTGSYYENINENLSIWTSYKSLFVILKLRPIQVLITFLLTWKIAFGLEKINQVKMIEAGVPKEILGLMVIPFQLIQIIAPILIGNLFNIKKPLKMFYKSYPIRMLMTAILAAWIYLAPWFTESTGSVTSSFILIYAVLNGLYSLISSVLDMSKVYFFTQISDKTVGGTYMTLLHTFSNLGYSWPATLSFYLLELFTKKDCIIEPSTNSTSQITNLSTYKVQNTTCSLKIDQEICTGLGGSCIITFDSFYMLTAVSLAFGVVWCFVYHRILKYLQALPFTAWTLNFEKDEGEMHF